MDKEQIDAMAEEVAGNVQKLTDFAEGLELLKRTAAGDPCQLSQSQANSIMMIIQIQSAEIKIQKAEAQESKEDPPVLSGVWCEDCQFVEEEDGLETGRCLSCGCPESTHSKVKVVKA